MKKLLMIAVAGAALTATPAMADDNVSIVATGSIAPTCQLSAGVRAVANNNDVVNAIGYDATTQTTLTTTGNSTVNLGVTTAQTLASVTGRCNTREATVTFNTANGFKLQNGSAGEIPYTLNLGGVISGATSQFTAVYQPLGGTNQFSRTLSFQLPAAVNPLLLAPGNYTDTITATIAPNL